MSTTDPTIRSGDLRHRLTLQSYSETRNASRQLRPTWTTVGTYWGLIEPYVGTEIVVGDQVVAETYHKITLRFGVNVRPRDRLVYVGQDNLTRYYNVSEVLNIDERKYRLEVLATEVIGFALVMPRRSSTSRAFGTVAFGKGNFG